MASGARRGRGPGAPGGFIYSCAIMGEIRAKWGGPGLLRGYLERILKVYVLEIKGKCGETSGKISASTKNSLHTRGLVRLRRLSEREKPGREK